MDRQAICTLSLQAGGEPKRLTSLSAKQMWPPSVSPDGKSLVFAYRELNGNADIYALKVADGALTQLTRGPNSNGHPVYAPDGKHMAFSSDRAKGGEYELWEMRPDGSALRQITHLARGPDRRCSYPRYFPDGRSLVFVVDESELWRVDLGRSECAQAVPSGPVGTRVGLV